MHGTIFKCQDVQHRLVAGVRWEANQIQGELCEQVILKSLAEAGSDSVVLTPTVMMFRRFGAKIHTCSQT